jgi:hypothetical protein
VGVAFYDHRNNPPSASPPVVTDYWFRHSSDGGANWSEDSLPVAGPFDRTAASAPGAAAHNYGDYEGLTTIGKDFVATIALSAPLPGANFVPTGTPKNTDVYFILRHSSR